jgi:hypothetical protein
MDWLSTIITMTSTKVLLNITLGERIYHRRGLRQGDPLSSLLFLLVMEVLGALIQKADAWSLFNQFLG